MSSNPVSSSLRQLSTIHVLVVDDDRRIAHIIRSVLKGLGFEHIYLEYTAESALEFLRGNSIDMIICDWMASDMDSAEMLRMVRKDAQNPNQLVPVIMLSGNSEKPHIETARDSGVTEYMTKPFTAKSLCKRIIAVIENPRSFVMSPKFNGHSRRRKKDTFEGTDRRERP